MWPVVAAADTVPPANPGRDLAAYMRARVADAAGRVDGAASGYAAALSARPGDTTLALRAYREALAAGDEPLAVRAAAVLRGTPLAPADLPLLAIARAARDNDPAAANAAIPALDAGVLRIIAPSLQGWAAFAAGADPGTALDRASATKEPVASRIALEQRGLLEIARGDPDRGLATVQAALAAGAPADLRLAAAALLFGANRDDAARGLLVGDDPVFVATRAAGVGAKPTLGFGVSRLLARIAADLTGRGNAAGPSDLALALSRTALIADPANDRARLLFASTLAGDGATDQAMRTLDGVDPRGAFAASAASARVAVLAGAGRDAEALAAARALATRDGAGPRDYQLYADRLVAANEWAAAAPWYARVIRGPDTGAKDAASGAPWTAWLQYGGALDQSGDWRAAKPALERAVALAPTQPVALNYLGYSLATHGEGKARALALLQKANALAPDDLSILDSLGWAYFLGGDTARALPLIERAAAGQPDNAEIGEHLGDIYWTLGRRYEARYAWRAAILTADPADAARLRIRIADGLPRAR